ncbi:MAG: hypothetical protein GEV08_00975 [Acidimicrobiia bacterium]|nr:hypothetical protein [Acidimicrobiia bacterium]
MVPDEGLLDAWPGVRVDADNAAYYAGLLEHRLLVNRCRDCGAWHHPPRSICPRCWSTAVAATEVTGRGRVALFTVLRQGPSRGGADYAAGHPLVAVELEEQIGLRVSGTVVDVPPGAITEAMAVELTWPDGEGAPDVLRFRAAGR